MDSSKKSIDIISRLPGCDGQAADAVSAYTQVKMEDAHKIIENSKIGMSRTFGFVYDDTNGQNHGPSMEDPVVPLERNLYGPSFGRTTMGKGNLRKFLLKHGWEKVPNW